MPRVPGLYRHALDQAQAAALRETEASRNVVPPLAEYLPESVLRDMLTHAEPREIVVI